MFTNGTVETVTPADDQLSVGFHDHILDGPAAIEVDLVVLATGQVPNSGVDIAAPAAEEPESESQVKVSVESILSLDYRQGQDIVATCAACWLGIKESVERLSKSEQQLADTRNILVDAGLKVDINQKTAQGNRHMLEMLIEDFGYDELEAPKENRSMC